MSSPARGRAGRGARSPRNRRRPNHRLVKIHRNYTVDEAASLLGIAKITVRRWIKGGSLPAVMDKKPVLILGTELSDFLQTRSAKRPKMPLHQCYCFRCRAPRSPALGMADYLPLTRQIGNLRALCEVCSSLMHKAVSAASLCDLERLLDLTIRQADQHLMDTAQPTLNDHLLEEPQSHA